MSLIAKASGEGAPPVPPGNYAGLCYSVVDLGTQNNGTFGPKHEIMLTFELPEVRIERQIEQGGPKVNQPRAISQRFTLSLSPKANLSKMLSSWRGKPFTDDELKGFDLRKLLGVPCLINVVHKAGKEGKIYANIATITPLPALMRAGMPAKPENPMVMFEIEQLQESKDIDPRLPEWVRKVIQKSEEYADLVNGDVHGMAVSEPLDVDDTPF